VAEFQAGTVTFLFTDIEGSTRLLKQLRSRYGEVLGEQRELLREAFKLHGGAEIDSQGDAFFVCFGRAKHAVAAAADAQRALAAHQWPEGVDVRVRIGVHTGEGEVSDGRYHGVAVHRAARIMAAAHGGQVLLSQTTKDLLDDEEEEAVGLGFRDLGIQRLKDLERPVHLYQLLIEGLPDEFPPIRTEADLGQAAEATIAPPPLYRRRTILVGALAGVVAAAIAIPLFALGGGGPSSAKAAVTPNSVAMIDPVTGKLVKDVPVDTNPGPITAGEGSVWVANLDDKTVSQINAKTGERVASIPTAVDGGPPTGITAGFGGLWVAYGNNGRIDEIDPKSRAIVKTTRVHEELGLRNTYGRRVLEVARGSLWLANLDATVLQIAPTGEIREKLDVGGGHSPALAIAADGSVWEAAENEASVWHVDSNTGAKIGTPIVIGGEVDAIVPSTSPAAVWVTDATHNQVIRIDPVGQTILKRIPVGEEPTAAVFAAGSLWVANSRSGTVSQLDPRQNKIVRTIHVGNRTSGIAFAGRRLWVTVARRLPVSRADYPTQNVVRLPLPLSWGPDEVDPAAGDNLNGSGLHFAWSVAYAICAKLLNYPDKSGSAGLKLVPEVATAMPSITNGGKTYTFTIRTGDDAFKFSPPWNQRVTGETFKYAIERTLAPAMHTDVRLHGFLDDVVGARAYETRRADHITGISAHDEKLTIHLTHAAPDFLARLSMPQFCAVPIGFPKEIGKTAIPGAGPYYVYASAQDGIVLRENPNYHGSRPHHFKQIEFVPEAWDPANVVAGKDDATLVFDGKLIERFGPRSRPARAGHQRVYIYDIPVTWFLAMNTTRPLFRNARVRRAVSYAIDRESMGTALFGPAVGGINLTPPTDLYIPPTLPGATAGHVYPLRGDLVQAKRLMAGRTGSGVFYYPQEFVPFGAAVMKNLRAIGIHLTPKAFPFSVAAANAQTRGAAFDLALGGFNPYYPDPAGSLNALFSGHSIRPQVNTNESYFDDPVYNRKLDAAAQLTGAGRVRAYARLNADIARRAAPAVAFANVKWPLLFSKRIGCQVWSPVPHYDLDVAALCLRK
jgi:class 3 adenylate cyclase/ABC-type oligopeptide transport system substrate-binding subunit